MKGFAAGKGLTYPMTIQPLLSRHRWRAPVRKALSWWVGNERVLRLGLTTSSGGSSQAGADDSKEAILAIKQQIYHVLLAGCGIAYASRMLMTILHRNRQLRAYSLSAPGRLKHTIEEMRAIVEAIERKDAEGAAAACRLHVQKAAGAALQVLRAQEAKKAG